MATQTPSQEEDTTTDPFQNGAENPTPAPTVLENSSWGKLIPWFLSIACMIVLAIIGNFLIENVNWFKESVYEISLIEAQEPVYRIHAYHMHMSMIKNSVGIFSGFAIMFLGLGVAFYSLKKTTTLDVKSSVWSANVATASPGIIAILVGGTIIMYCVGNKSDFPPFPVIFENGTGNLTFPTNQNNSDYQIEGDQELPIIDSPFDNTEVSLDSLEAQVEIAH